MKNIVIATAAAALALAAAPAFAQTAPANFYGTLGYSHIDADSAFNLEALTARAGVRFADYFGAEVEAALGVSGYDVAGSEIELKRSVAAYAVGFVPLSPQFDIVARIGYGNSKVEVSGAGGAASADGDSWNYGVGGQYFFDGANGVRAEFTRHDFTNGGGKADVWGVSYVRKF